jgi:deoxyribodipyrimidine photo-lyase
MVFTPTRAAALDHLATFVPQAARYAGRRNFDLGQRKHEQVSQLSPYIRTRLITEEEVSRAVLEKHSASAAEKFLQEIAWRTYWKGWLEMRPEVWDHYLKSLPHLKKSFDYEVAVSAHTGIECFDHWVQELVETGYLHNHARMWFASIWIFTLKLPWQLGADFFLNHLLDGDPAANTLSWRWVAGLHTPGKNYGARASNIEKYTCGQFNPAGQLAENAQALESDRIFEKTELNLPKNPRPSGRIGHLMFPEDLAAAPSEIGEIHASAAFIPPSMECSALISAFLNGAIDDALTRSHGTRIHGDFQHAVNQWVLSENLDSVIISHPTVGPVRDFLTTQKLPIAPHNFVRGWDRRLWPQATAGFFKLKKALPKIHASLRENDLFPHL